MKHSRLQYGAVGIYNCVAMREYQTNKEQHYENRICVNSNSVHFIWNGKYTLWHLNTRSLAHSLSQSCCSVYLYKYRDSKFTRSHSVCICVNDVLSKHGIADHTHTHTQHRPQRTRMKDENEREKKKKHTHTNE